MDVSWQRPYPDNWKGRLHGIGSTLGMTAEEAAAYCEQPVGVAMSGCWYLASRGALVRADHWLISEITRLVNGPAMLNAGLRLEYSDAMLKALGGSIQA